MDTSETTTTVAAPPKKRSWRRHSDEFRSQVIEMARQAHTSVASVALANGLNANMLRRWVREAELADEDRGDDTRQRDAVAFVQLPMTAPASAPTAPVAAEASVVVEIQLSGATVRASLPLDSRSAAWLREVTG